MSSKRVVDLIPTGFKDTAKKRGRPMVERSKAKYPWFKFFPADWLSDEALGACDYRAKGVWIDLIAYIHKDSDGGRITRSFGQFAALLHLTNSELSEILDELATTGTAEITYTRVNKETGEISVDKPVDKFTEQIIKSNLSQLSQNNADKLFANSIFVTILSRRMRHDQIKRDTERLRKRRLRAKPPET